jgi:hypothetical protein
VSVLSSRLRTASTGAKKISRGSTPPVAYPVIRAIGVSPCALANASEATTSALEPSLSPGAFPAVTVPPSFRNAGLSFASVSTLVSFRGDSSDEIVVGAPFPGTWTGRISPLNFPASVAATAFR